MSRYRVGVDIGGTFTDFSVYDTQSDALLGLKTPTVPLDPVEGLVNGLRILSSERKISPADIEYFVHGTTIAVNTLIERKGAKLAMFVTRGFRDMLIIQRLSVPRPHYWHGSRPDPLISRDLVFEIDERLRADGSVHEDISEDSLRKAVAGAKAAGVAGIVICFLHSFRNDAHERRARAVVEREAPDLFVCCSSEIWPRMREYERSIVSIINAYVTPRVSGYLRKLETRLQSLGLQSAPFITQSNGGVMTAHSAGYSPAETLLSGPASGVIGAVQVSVQDGIRDFITLDIGGTSADVAFVNGGAPQISQAEHIADFPVMMPVIGVSSIGAGGGSIIWLDDAGVLRLGPESAGSDPGPACYGRGSTRPALSDAFLAGGYLNPSTFAGGRLRLDDALSRKALAPVAKQLGLDLQATVEGVLNVATAMLYAEISNLAAQRGLDVREYTIVAFGGAGALMACRLAEELGIGRVLVPLQPGTLCAMGALSADVARSFIKTIIKPLVEAKGEIAESYRYLEREAATWVKSEVPQLDSLTVQLSADMRYVGQSFEVDVPLDTAWVANGDIAAIASTFHEVHRKVYAHADPSVPVEIVDMRLMISGAMPKPRYAELRPANGAAAPQPAKRSIVIDGKAEEVPVWQRGDLHRDFRLEGPCIVDQEDTTVLVLPEWTGTVYPSGNLHLERAV